MQLHRWTLSTELILQEGADVCQRGREQLSLAVLHRHIHEPHGLGQSRVSGSSRTHFCSHANDRSAPASLLQHRSGRSYEWKKIKGKNATVHHQTATTLDRSAILFYFIYLVRGQPADRIPWCFPFALGSYSGLPQPQPGPHHWLPASQLFHSRPATTPRTETTHQTSWRWNSSFIPRFGVSTLKQQANWPDLETHPQCSGTENCWDQRRNPPLCQELDCLGCRRGWCWVASTPCPTLRKMTHVESRRPLCRSKKDFNVSSEVPESIKTKKPSLTSLSTDRDSSGRLPSRMALSKECWDGDCFTDWCRRLAARDGDGSSERWTCSLRSRAREEEKGEITQPTARLPGALERQKQLNGGSTLTWPAKWTACSFRSRDSACWRRLLWLKAPLWSDPERHWWRLWSRPWWR